MCEFLYAFDNYDYDNFFKEMIENMKENSESLDNLHLRFMHLFYRFDFDDVSFVSEWFLYLFSLSNEGY